MSRGFTLNGSPAEVRGALCLVSEALERVLRINERMGSVTSTQLELVATSVCIEHGNIHQTSAVKASLMAMLDSLYGIPAVDRSQKHVEALELDLDETAEHVLSDTDLRERQELEDCDRGPGRMMTNGKPLRAAQRAVNDAGRSAYVKWTDLFGDTWVIHRELKQLFIRGWKDGEEGAATVDVSLAFGRPETVIFHNHRK
jgi:hypothetical protein